TYAQTILLSTVGQSVVSKLRRDLFRHLLRLPLTFHTGQRTGDLLMRLTGDIILLRELVVAGLVDAIAAAITLGATLVVMLWLEPQLTLVSLLVAPAIALLGAAFADRMRLVVRRSRDKEGVLSGHAGEALGAIAV